MEQFLKRIENLLTVKSIVTLALTGADDELPTDTAHFLDEQFQGDQRLPDGHLVDGQVAQPG